MKKQKGGAEKERERKRKFLERSAESCHKISDLFGGKRNKLNDNNSTSSNQFVSENSDIPNDNNTTSSNQCVSENSDIPHDNNDIINSEIGSDKATTNHNKDSDASSETSDTCGENVEIHLSSSDKQIIIENIDFFFTRPSNRELDLFLKGHPRQPLISSCNNDLIYNKKTGGKRNWLSYNESKQMFYCWICLGLCKDDQLPSLATGISIKISVKHIYTRLEEHEMNRTHINSSEAYLLHKNKGDIHSLLFSSAAAEHRMKIENNRQIIIRIIETIKMIGKRGLSYRGGSENEAAYTLLNDNIDHGNFLEIILLIAKFDPILHNHIQKVAEQSKKNRLRNLNRRSLHPIQPSTPTNGNFQESEECGQRRGRGAFISLLSKTTVNEILSGISNLIKKKISDDVKRAEIFSIQIDTTQDINVVDQCSVIIRFVTDRVVHERLIRLINCNSSKGKDMYEMIAQCLKDLDLDIRRCVGNSTDGASNMQGQYKGFTTWLSKDSPGQIHVWCYAHVLNLVVADVTNQTIPAVSLFGLINKTAVFVRESYLRMNVWKNALDTDSNSRFINIIGETRWWAKEKALTKIFDTKNGFFVILCETLHTMTLSNNFNAEVKFKAKCFLDGFLKYETIIMSVIFKKIFFHISPLSKYLQTSGMDLLQSYRMVEETLQALKNMSRDFESIIQETDKFINMVNISFLDKNFPGEIQTEFPLQRTIRKTKFHDETCGDNNSSSPIDDFKIKVFFVTMDQVINSIESRFVKHKQLYTDFECFHPSSFESLSKLPEHALKNVTAKLQIFFPSIDHDNLKTQLIDLASKWHRLSKSLPDEFTGAEIHQTNDIEGDGLKNKCNTCRNCILCCYRLLLKYNLYAEVYPDLEIAYKYILTLSITQVSCERSFSKLNYILNKVRNSLTQENVETFMLMAIEKDVLYSLNNNEIIDHLTKKSAAMTKFLTI